MYVSYRLVGRDKEHYNTVKFVFDRFSQYIDENTEYFNELAESLKITKNERLFYHSINLETNEITMDEKKLPPKT